jgi:hypothetical protein
VRCRSLRKADRQRAFETLSKSTKIRSFALEIFIVDGGMFSHVVIFWANPSKPDAPNELIAAAKKYLASIPGIVNFHVGKMVNSHRDVVDQTVPSRAEHNSRTNKLKTNTRTICNTWNL